MIPSRWSSAIAILRRRLYEAAAERRYLLDQLRQSERERTDALFDRRDQSAIENELFGPRQVRCEEPVPFQPPDAAAQRGVGTGDAMPRSQRLP
jgi:hypothetical protein